MVFGYSLLNISSTIRDLKLEGMPKYKKVWVWHTDIFALWFWVPQNYMKICFRNISSAKLKWKECTRRHDFSGLGLTQVGYFIFNFPWPIFIDVVFAIYCHLLSFLKNHKLLLSLTFALCTSNLFHHKYIDKSFTNGNKKQVSLRNQFACETSFPAKPVCLRNQFACETSLPAKPILDAEVL